MAFHITEEEIELTPSQKDGISKELEMEQRIFGCEWIQKAGILLRLPQFVMVTAQVFLHRFYFRSSLKKHDVKDISMASLFLATKSEETPRKLRDICNVFWRLHLRTNNLPITILDVYSEHYANMKQTIIESEQLLLRALGFMVQVIQPHKYLLNYMKTLNCSEEFMQKAWNYTNDSMRTICCIIYAPEKVAVASMYLASLTLQFPLPETPHPWWKLFDTSWTEIEEISRLILSLYTRNPPKYVYLLEEEIDQEEKSSILTQMETKSDHLSSEVQTSSNHNHSSNQEQTSSSHSRSSSHDHSSSHHRHSSSHSHSSSHHRHSSSHGHSSSRHRHSSSHDHSSSRHGHSSSSNSHREKR